jgi:hypothetical protein
MPKLDYLWVFVGVAIGLALHTTFTHPKSPLNLSGINFYNFT